MHNIVSSTTLKGRETTRAPGNRIPSALISCYLTFFITLAIAFSSEQFHHWFVIPVAACGVLIGVDLVDWIRGRHQLFSPIGIIGVLGFHFFFLAPLLHVLLDYWMRYITPPDDWRPWLGYMAALNFAGILVYRFVRGCVLSRSSNHRKLGTVWQIDERLFPPLLILALILTATLQVAVYASYGGIAGYINSYEARLGNTRSFVGMGIVFGISESFPILALMLYAYYANKKNVGKSWTSIVLVLLIFLAVSILFGGLRGSRSNTMWKMFWAAGIIHFWLRPMSKKMLAVGLLFLVGFMYVYGFYKSGGLVSVSKFFQDPRSAPALEQETGRTLEVVLLGDLGRSDVQAFLLYRLSRPDSDYRYALGRTYVAGFATAIPRNFWPNRPVGKVKEGTEAQYGQGSYRPGVNVSTRVYGLAGEALLNFGIVAIPFVFAVFGYVVGRVERLVLKLVPQDARWLLAPLLINLSFVVLQGDSDNITFFLVKNGALPFLVIFVSSKITNVSQTHSAKLL